MKKKLPKYCSQFTKSNHRAVPSPFQDGGGRLEHSTEAWNRDWAQNFIRNYLHKFGLKKLHCVKKIHCAINQANSHLHPSTTVSRLPTM